MLKRTLGLLLTASISIASTARAQQQLPPAADPGRLPKQLERPQRPESPPELVIPGLDVIQPPSGAEDLRFRVHQIGITGMTVYSADDLAPLYEPLLAREVSLADLYRLAAEITVRYRNDGFVITRANRS